MCNSRWHSPLGGELIDRNYRRYVDLDDAGRSVSGEGCEVLPDTGEQEAMKTLAALYRKQHVGCKIWWFIDRRCRICVEYDKAVGKE